jgi:hypothetical protein
VSSVFKTPKFNHFSHFQHAVFPRQTALFSPKSRPEEKTDKNTEGNVRSILIFLGGLRDVKRLSNHPGSIEVEVELTVSPRSSRYTDTVVLGVQRSARAASVGVIRV